MGWVVAVRTESSVVVTGSLAFDHIMNLPGVFTDYILPDKIHKLNVSFLVDTLRKEFGGTGGNIAYNLALLGIKVELVATIGKDGDEYISWLANHKVDISGVRKFNDILTASGFVITDKQDNQIWNFYGGAMRKASQLSLQSIKVRPGLVTISPNDPEAIIQYVKECQESDWEYLFDPAFYIPTLSVEDLTMAVKGARIVVGNDYEVALLRDKLQATSYKPQANQILITTLGDKGSTIRQGNKQWRIPAVKVKKIVDPTGAGDAYRAGFVAGYIRGLPLPVCGRMGAVGAAYTVEKYGTQTHKFTLKGFQRRYEANFL
ncbi:MAG: carbohydrate kinase family protein [Candidatus Chisholmbacteria bacterium]|nr:carbohydrate kinase family protein [Candidatus Chisholmbacteria bacterium]